MAEDLAAEEVLTAAEVAEATEVAEVMEVAEEDLAAVTVAGKVSFIYVVMGS